VIVQLALVVGAGVALVVHEPVFSAVFIGAFVLTMLCEVSP